MTFKSALIMGAAALTFAFAAPGATTTATAAPLSQVAANVGEVSIVELTQGRRIRRGRGVRRGRGIRRGRGVRRGRGIRRGRNRRGRNVAIGLGAAALTLGVIGAIAASERNRNRGYSSRHVDRCLRAYRSYDVGSNTWVDYSGRTRTCRL